MSDVPMPANEGPKGLSEEAVAEWLRAYNAEPVEGDYYGSLARAVLALVEAKVREAVPLARQDEWVDRLLKIRGWTYTKAEVVARVMGREVKRG